jgi:hypothetical protein
MTYLSLLIIFVVDTGVLDITFCDKVYQLHAPSLWFSPGTLVSFTNKTDSHDIAEVLLKVALNTVGVHVICIYYFSD